MFDPRVPFMNALLKSHEMRVLGQAQLERLGTPGVRADARDVLRDTDIGAWLDGTSWPNARERDLALWRYLSESLERLELRRFFPPEARRFGRAYLLKYDVGNIKAVLQSLALDHPPQLLPIGVLQARGRLAELAAVRDPEALVETLTRLGFRKFALALRGFDSAGSRRARLAVEAALEGEYQRELRHAVRGFFGAHVLLAACGLIHDLANLSILCRILVTDGTAARQACFIPGGHLLEAQEWHEALAHGLRDLPRRLEHEAYRGLAADIVAVFERTGAVSAIEAVIERYRLNTLRGLLAPQLAPAAAMAWLIVLKEIELRNVRLILTAAEDAQPFEAVRRQLLV